jgi:indolepyruvate ferredoxin oxidoreductase beta subunit
MNNLKNIIITGVGGQGNVLAARLLAVAALEAGMEVSVGDVFGLTQRGGSVASHVRWSTQRRLPPLVPKGQLDVLVAFEPLEALRMQTQYGRRDTVVLVNNQPVLPIGVQAGRFDYPDWQILAETIDKISGRVWMVPGSRAARELGNIQVLNVIMIGSLFASGVTGLNHEDFEAVIVSQIPKKYASLNLKAFRRGRDLIKEL